MNTYELTIPIGQPIKTLTPNKKTVTIRKTTWLNANQKKHWGDSSPAVRTWRQAAVNAARAKSIPAMQKAEIHCYITKPTKRIYDPANLAPTAKAIIDGLVENYGLLPNDNYHYLDGPHLHHHTVQPGVEQITVRITQLA